MISVKIGGQERQLIHTHDLDESWVRQQMSDATACVVVRIDTETVKLVLATASCPATEGVARRLRPGEQRVVDLWNDRGLNGGKVRPGQAIAFFAQLEQALQ